MKSLVQNFHASLMVVEDGDVVKELRASTQIVGSNLEDPTTLSF